MRGVTLRAIWSRVERLQAELQARQHLDPAELVRILQEGRRRRSASDEARERLTDGEALERRREFRQKMREAGIIR